jgi:hypothetical protein
MADSLNRPLAIWRYNPNVARKLAARRAETRSTV